VPESSNSDIGSKRSAARIVADAAHASADALIELRAVMAEYLASRLLQALITIIGISVVVFVLARLSGDPASLLILPEETAADREALRQQLGLDEPLLLQYGLFIKGAFTLDFASSFRFGQPALNVYLERFPNTLQLGLVASLIATSGGILIGVCGAVKSGRLVDPGANILALVGQAAPSFALAIFMKAVFAVSLCWLPTSGMGDWKSFIMPSIALAWFSIEEVDLGGPGEGEVRVEIRAAELCPSDLSVVER
jgi:peptide/nickel transport system permease protein